jgi:hypothetical protein
MTPRQVDELSPAEYEAMYAYALAEQREQARQARVAQRKARG